MARAAAKEAPRVFDPRVCIDTSLADASRDRVPQLARFHVPGKHLLGLRALPMRGRIRDKIQTIRDANNNPAVEDGFQQAADGVHQRREAATKLIVDGGMGIIPLGGRQRRRTRMAEAEGYALEKIDKEVGAKRDMHEIDPADILPASLHTLSKDAQERADQLTGDRSFLALYNHLQPDGVGDITQFWTNLGNARTFTKTEVIGIDSYLSHMSTCPGEPEADRAYMAGIDQARQEYRNISKLELLPPEAQLGEEEAAFLRTPFKPIADQYALWQRAEKIWTLEDLGGDNDRPDGDIVKMGELMRDGSAATIGEGTFLAQTGMTRPFLRDLRQAGEEIDLDADIARHYASAALLAINLHNKGVVDAGSEHFQALFDDVFPQMPEQYWTLMLGEVGRIDDVRAQKARVAAEAAAEKAKSADSAAAELVTVLS